MQYPSYHSVFFLDIDDCLIKTSILTKEHLEALEKGLRLSGVPLASEITHEFAASFRRLYDNHQGKQLSPESSIMLRNYMTRLTELQRPIKKTYGEIKRWSREVCLFISADKFNVKLTYNQILLAINSLWEQITQKSVFYDDTLPFLSKLFANKIPFYLITSSDSRLIYDESTGYFQYDPERSKLLKMKRLKRLLDLGIPSSHIFIGDPIDKPDPYIFKEALHTSVLETGHVRQACLPKSLCNRDEGGTRKLKFIMVGDSIENDLLPAKKAGMDAFYFLNRNAKEKKVIRKDGIIEVDSLYEITIQ